MSCQKSHSTLVQGVGIENGNPRLFFLLVHISVMSVPQTQDPKAILSAPILQHVAFCLDQVQFILLHNKIWSEKPIKEEVEGDAGRNCSLQKPVLIDSVRR